MGDEPDAERTRFLHRPVSVFVFILPNRLLVGPIWRLPKSALADHDFLSIANCFATAGVVYWP